MIENASGPEGKKIVQEGIDEYDAEQQEMREFAIAIGELNGHNIVKAFIKENMLYEQFGDGAIAAGLCDENGKLLTDDEGNLEGYGSVSGREYLPEEIKDWLAE